MSLNKPSPQTTGASPFGMFSPVTPFTGADHFPEQQQQESKWKEKQDRQLRLWGIHGQERIDAANVCLLNGSAVGAETLKNMVLPGFGKFTVIDGSKLQVSDLGVNFFCSVDGLDKSRAKNVMDNLAELNPDVKGNFLEADTATVMNDDPEFLDRQHFNYIIASNLDPVTLRKVADFCWKKNKALVIVRSYGLIGYVRIVVRTHDVIEAKPEQEKDDLRISEPFEKLTKFVNAHNFDKMNPEQMRTTPYPVLLIKFLQDWKAANNNKLPSTKEEKESFKQLIQDFHLKFVVNNDPEKKSMRNFEEAIEKAHFAYLPYELPENVQQVFEDKTIATLTKDSSNFAFLAAAVKKFYETEGKGVYLPCQGRVPDMEADTQRYIKMQSIYRRKAKADADAVTVHLKTLLKQAGKSEDSIKDVDIIDFCKNAFNIRIYHYRSLAEELSAPNKEEISNKLSEDTNSPMIFYLCLLGVDRFYEKHGHYPGDDGKPDTDKDAQELKTILQQILKEYELADDAFNVEDYSKEIARYGAAELHNISSLTGGVAAQELIKICTKQRLPVFSTWVFSGISSAAVSANL